MKSLPLNTQVDNALIMRLINNVPIFAGINIAEQRVIAQKSMLEHWGPEKTIIEEGQLGNHLYIIIKGVVIVSKWNRSRGWIQVAQLGAGDFFGEIAIIRNIPRTARIDTLSPCELLVLSNNDFLKIYQNFPQKTRNNISLIVEKRLQELNLF